MRWWGYNHNLLPIDPLIPADFSLVPVVFMIVYQHFSQSYRTFLLSNIVLGFLSAYIAEPIMIRLNIYLLYSWKLAYSFLFYIVAAHISRWIIVKTKKQ
jgi:hypothetical protein